MGEMTAMNGNGMDTYAEKIAFHKEVVFGVFGSPMTSWRADDGDQLQSYEGHHKAIGAITVYKECLFSGSWDGSLRSWNVKTGDVLRTFEGHTRSVNTMLIHDDVLYSASDDGTIASWNPETAKRNRVFYERDVNYDEEPNEDGGPEGLEANLHIKNGELFAASSKGRFWVWNLESGHARLSVLAHAGLRITCIVPHNACIFTSALEGTIRAWDMTTGAARMTLTGHSDSVTHIILSGNMLLSASLDHSIRVWSAADGSQHRSFDQGAGINVMCYDATSGALYAGDATGKVQVWDPLTGVPRAAYSKPNTDGVHNIVVQKEYMYVVTWDPTLQNSDVYNRKYYKYKLEDRTLAYEYSGNMRDILSIKVVGDIVISGGWDYNVTSWNLMSGERIHVFGDRGPGTGGHTSDVNQMTYNDRYGLFSCSEDTTVRRWNIQTGTCIQTFKDPAQTAGSTFAMVYNDVIFVGAWDGVLREYDINLGTLKSATKLHEDAITCFDIAMNKIFTCGRDEMIVISDPKTHQVIRSLGPFPDIPFAITVQNEGRRIFTTIDTVIWEITDTGEKVREFRGHNACLEAVEIHGDLMFSCADDKTCRIWDLKDGVTKHIFADHKARIMSMHVNRERNFIITGSTKLVRSQLPAWHGASQTMTFTTKKRKKGAVGSLVLNMELYGPIIQFLIAIILAFVDTVQLLSFVFNRVQTWGQDVTKTASQVRTFGVAGVNVGYGGAFWAIVALIIILFILLATSEALEWKTFLRPANVKLQLLWKLMGLLVKLLSSTAFLAISNIFLSAFKCTLRSDGNYALVADPSTVCYQGIHNVYMGIAVVCMIFYFPVCLRLGLVFNELPNMDIQGNPLNWTHDNRRAKPPVHAFSQAGKAYIGNISALGGKLLLNMFVIFASDDVTGFITGFAQVVIAGILGIFSLVAPRYVHVRANRVRFGLDCGVFWTFIISLMAIVKAFSVEVALILLPTGLIAFILMGYALMGLRLKTEEEELEAAIEEELAEGEDEKDQEELLAEAVEDRRKSISLGQV